ncbi:MAG: MBL fold metallo-hydrolase [Spirochaetales bacterium]|nr:MBL fold metallo-hydrolase [Spirochaetales bacterium]
MNISEHLHMVGSGSYGLSHPDDCHVFLFASGAKGEEHLALVDAGSGSDTAAILENVRRAGYDPRRIERIFLTHAHRDHAGGCASLIAELPECRIAASAAEAELLEHGTADQLGLNRLGFSDDDRAEVLPPQRVDDILTDGQVMHLGDVRVEAVLTPGHNPGCMCFLVEIDSKRVLFAGDTIFCGGYISVGNWPGSELKTYQEHIGRLSGLNVDVLLSGHHVFTVSNGQQHIDRAVETFAGLWPPPQINTVL